MIDTTNKIFRISCGAEFALKLDVFDHAVPNRPFGESSRLQSEAELKAET